MDEIDFNEEHFLISDPQMINNNNLREPQISAYHKVYNHFVTKSKTSHAIIVLPTGVGKTGLMAILPYHISEGRVLIITPGTTIRDSIIDSLDPDNYDNFWLKRKVFKDVEKLPNLIEYEGDDTPLEIINNANIVVLNVHKLQNRLDSSLLKRVNEDFFDMILIDEAHHSTADTWVEAVNYFSDAKIVKLTGTPFRSDGKPIVGEEVFKYKLSAAMANNYVKSLEDIVHVPGKLYLTIDNKYKKEYTVKKIYDMDLKDENWISRSVAYSKNCSEKVVVESLKQLEEKTNKSSVPHKIIAVTCSIDHAEQIKEIYINKGYETTIVHSKMSDEKLQKAHSDIENHRVQVVVNVAMLGEGFDHKYLSVAAIFRPFRSKLPYAQFVGRILRRIPEDEVESVEDNIGVIVSHQYLYLKDLWDYYKKEIQESDTIKYLNELEISDDESETIDGKRDLSIGNAREEGEGKVIVDPYITTELLKKRKEEIAKRKEAIKNLQDMLEIQKEEAAKIYDSSQTSKSKIKRPDQYFKNRKKDIDHLIKYEIVPELINEFNLQKDGDEIIGCRLFKDKFSWIRKIGNNAGMLSAYFSDALRHKISKKRKDWNLSDYDIAFEQIDAIKEYAENVLHSYLEG
ncbi:DEAD/DEAH box helicase [Halanaerobium hydrogeniformans]|uniref:Type III restriction protein res subunit n=1 Tax=Halanaerobium hydrogeniformans TaxID=656519 RepID=E4RPM6_HALHG|nr:DEAD/DEAH box helicase family protein [Halanaerobium hydrogeniformans]ADQ14049.1 type III restriction protein res subunit [Halanaerobium hydrogeniformans]